MAPRLKPLKKGDAWQTGYAYLYLTVLIFGPVAITALAAFAGLVELDLSITASPDLGFAIEWLIGGVTIVFLLWTLVQVVRVTGVRFINSLARIAHNYELPSQAADEVDEDGQ